MKTKQQAAMQQALNTLEAIEERCSLGAFHADAQNAIATLSQALEAEQQAEPVAFCDLTRDGKGIAYFDGKPCVMPGKVGNDCHPHPLYTRPQPAQKPLTDDQIREMVRDVTWEGSIQFEYRIVRAVERAHKIGGNK